MDAVFIGQINKNSFIIISDKERIIKLEKFLLEWLIEKSKKDFEFKIIWADEIGCFHDSDSILNEAMKSNSI